MTLPTRKPVRLKDYDYASSGVYFVTLCVARREWLLRQISSNLVGANCVRPPEFPSLSDIGVLVEREIAGLDAVYSGVRVDKFCIMPDHIHLMLRLSPGRSDKSPDLSRIIKQFKGKISKQLGRSIWQRSFYDRVVRNEEEYREIWQYIDRNPLQWKDDWLSRE